MEKHRLPCCAGFSFADQGSPSHPRGDFAPYRALFSVSYAHPDFGRSRPHALTARPGGYLSPVLTADGKLDCAPK